MQTARFTNFSNEVFTGYWNGKGKKFLPGQSLYMPDYLARHFAKHLANRELLKKGLEKDTSPKVKIKPDGTEYVDNVNYTEMFNRAYAIDEEGVDPEKDSIDVQIEVANKNRAERIVKAGEVKNELPEKSNGEQDPTQPQVIVPPDFDSDEESFPNEESK